MSTVEATHRTGGSIALERIAATVQGRASDRQVTVLYLIIFVLLFGRPQELFDVRFVSIALQVIGTLLWFTRGARGVVGGLKLVMVFLVWEAIRLTLGATIAPGLVINRFQQFQHWRDLVFQCGATVFPIVAFMSSGAMLRRLLFVIYLVAAWLALWAITHSGVGPGGALLDENDNCFAHLFYFGIFLPFLFEKRGPTRRGELSKMRALIIVTLLVGGIIATFSRGGFLGLLGAVGYFFFKSKSKGMLLGVFAVVGVAAASVLASSAYMKEMGTISASDDTAQERLHYWTLAVRIWKDYPIFGGGLGGPTYRLGDYQTAEELLERPNASGRAVHSLYFQALSDVGLFGCVLLIAIFTSAFRQNTRSLRSLDALLREFDRARDNPLSVLREGEGLTPAELLQVLKTVRGEAYFMKKFVLGINVAFVGCLVAGVGVSVLYYPPLWCLCGLSMASMNYITNLKSAWSETVARPDAFGTSRG